MVHISTNKWDLRFMELAELVASWSKDPSTKVGAVITQGREILSLGYNGFPSSLRDDIAFLEDRTKKYPRTVHAEANALLRMGSTEVSSETRIYVTAMPCPGCAALILGKGIRRIYTKEPPKEFIERWGLDISMEMMKESCSLTFM